jgi:hypothetical protein
MKEALIKISVIAILILIVSLSIFRLLFSSVDSTEFKVFKSYSRGYFLQKLLGIIPKNYVDSFKITVTEEYDNTQVLYIVDKKSSAHPYFVALKTDGELDFLKGYPFMFQEKIQNLEEQDYRTHVSRAINIKVFNSYLEGHQLNKQQAIEKYCFFLSREESLNSFLILKNVKETEKVVKNHNDTKAYLKAFPNTYNLITPNEIDFNEVTENSVYCWFINKGVVKFTFAFDDAIKVKSVESEIVGFLGTETPLM